MFNKYENMLWLYYAVHTRSVITCSKQKKKKKKDYVTSYDFNFVISYVSEYFKYDAYSAYVSQNYLMPSRVILNTLFYYVVIFP